MALLCFVAASAILGLTLLVVPDGHWLMTPCHDDALCS